MIVFGEAQRRTSDTREGSWAYANRLEKVRVAEDSCRDRSDQAHGS